MNSLLSMVENIALEQILSKAVPASQSIKTTGIFIGTCLFLFMASLTALFIGFYLYLNTIILPHYAAFIVSAALLILSGCFYLILIVYKNYKKAIQKKKQKEMEELITLFTDHLRKDVQQTTIDNPEMSMITSALAGLIIGRLFS